MEEKIRVYKEVMLWFTRDEHIQELTLPKKEGEVEVEYVNAITRAQRPILPEHCGRKIDLYT